MKRRDEIVKLMDKAFFSVKCSECGAEVSTKYPYYGMNGSRIVHCKCGNVIRLKQN